MLKLFDFKFLILLGLTLVVYFMYKEIDYQRERIQQCENQIKALLETNPNQFHNEDTPQIVNQEAALQEESIVQVNKKNSKNSRPPLQYPKQNEQQQVKQEQSVKQQVKQQVKQVVQSKQEQTEQVVQVQEKNLVLNLPKKMIEKKVVSSETTEIETDEKLIETENKHIEIYSNDNENCMETTISDSLINGKNILLQKSNSDTSETSEQNVNNFEYGSAVKNEQEVSKEVDNSEESSEKVSKHESDASDEESEEVSEEASKDESDDVSDKKSKKEDSNSENIDENIDLSEDSKEIAKKENSDKEETKKTSSNSSVKSNSSKKENKKTSRSSKSSKEEFDDILKDLKIEISNDMIKSSKLDLPALLKMKVPELHNLALKENITLEKKINGVSKKKTKQELAEEIFAKKNI